MGFNWMMEQIMFILRREWWAFLSFNDQTSNQDSCLLCVVDCVMSEVFACSWCLHLMVLVPPL